jgi:2'-5' RNA ligase
MLYVIVVVLPEPLRSRSESIQNEYKNPDWKITLPPHITIVPPFGIRQDSACEELIRQIGATARQLKSFVIRLGGIRNFNNNVGTIYLRAERGDELIWMQNKVLEAATLFIVEKTNYPDNFVPHTTLSGDIPKNELDSVYSRMKKLDLEAKFKCVEISLYKKSASDENWIHVKSFDLG